MRPRKRQALQRCLDLRHHRKSSTSLPGSFSLDCLAVGGLVAVSFSATMACLLYFMCCGGTLLFALVCFASCGYVQLSLPLVGKLHPYLFRCILNASMHFDIFIFAGHFRLGAFCEAHLTSGGLNFLESWT